MAATDLCSKAEHRRRVLLVEDNQGVARVISIILSRRGHEVMVAIDGLEAIEIAQQELPDSIICDLNMPQLDGFGVIDALRGNLLTAQIPVCALTAQQDARARAIRSGFDRFLVKPASVADLVEFIESDC